MPRVPAIKLDTPACTRPRKSNSSPKPAASETAASCATVAPPNIRKMTSRGHFAQSAEGSDGKSLHREQGHKQRARGNQAPADGPDLSGKIDGLTADSHQWRMSDEPAHADGEQAQTAFKQ